MDPFTENKEKEKGLNISTPLNGKPGKATITTREVKTKKQMAEFINFPLQLYKGNNFFVPQLKKDLEVTFDPSKNPAFEFCEARYWLAYKNNRIAGRIAGIINHSFIETWKQPFMRFGWFDFIEDEEVTKALLNEVEQWARQKGLKAIHGPLGFTNFDYTGMLTYGFQETGTFITLYNFPYYPELVEKAGLKKETGWVEYKIKVPAAPPEKLLKAVSIVERRLQLKSIRPKTKKDVRTYAVKIFELINSAYSGLFGVVPMTEKQIQYNIHKYLSFIKPEFISLVTNNNNELVAFGIAIPSLSKALQKANGNLYPFGFLHLLKAFRKNKVADLCLVAVKKELQGKGVNALVMRDIIDAFILFGIEYAESNPELEENNKVQSLWDGYESQQHKRRSCYIKYLTT